MAENTDKFAYDDFLKSTGFGQKPNFASEMTQSHQQPGHNPGNIPVNQNRNSYKNDDPSLSNTMPRQGKFCSIYLLTNKTNYKDIRYPYYYYNSIQQRQILLNSLKTIIALFWRPF